MVDYFKSDEKPSSLQTGRGVNNSYRKCLRCPKYRKNHQKEHSAKSRESQCRNPSPDGDAPIYPNDPDPDPEWNPPEYNPTPPGGYKDQILLYLIAGYILGIFLVLIWYYWNPQRARSDLNGTWFFIILFFLLLLILSQRRPARCIAVLCFSTLAHYQSRALIIALAFLIAFWGPVMNIIRNIDIMANSLNCQQNLLIYALWSVNSMISDPLQLMEELFKRTVDEVLGMTTKLEKFFVKLENPIADIYATYGLCASWLTLQNEQFGKRMGAPYTRCLRAGNLSIFQYQTEIGDQTSESCNQELFSWFCEGLKGVNSFFYDNLLLPQMVIEDIFQRLQICFLKIRLMFLATISFNHSGKPYPRILLTDRDLLCRQDTTTNKLSYIYFWLYLMVLILLLTVIIRSIDFRFRYLMSEHFENVYITKEFEVYEEQQSQIMGVQLLPLNNCEDNKYVKIASLRLLPGERRAMYRSGAFLFITGIQLYCLCLVDYSLYSMLALLRQHGNMTEADQPSSYSKMVIKGGGQIGSFLRDLVHAFEPKVLQMNSYNCLPVPENPKYWLYFWILVLYVLAWIMVFWEPYGLRQRHRIMAYFHPEVSCRRVQYLHYSILKGRRKSVLQLSSQRARFLKCYRYDNKLVSCISCLSSLTSWFFSGCRGVCIGRSCTICRKPLTKSDHVFCDLPECSGVYCYTCFIECNNNCVLCSSPSECDFSEIGDSSDYWDYSYCCPENVHSE